MTSKRMLILLAAMAGWILQGTLMAAPTTSTGDSDKMFIGETKYTVEVDENQTEPVMVLLRYDGISNVIGTVSFENGNNAPPQDVTDNPGLPGDSDGGTTPIDDPPAHDPVDSGDSPVVNPPGNGNTNPVGDDYDDQVPGNLPGKDTQTPSVDNGSPGTLPVPEPSAVVLSATGLIIIGLLKSRQQKN